MFPRVQKLQLYCLHLRAGNQIIQLIPQLLHFYISNKEHTHTHIKYNQIKNTNTHKIQIQIATLLCPHAGRQSVISHSMLQLLHFFISNTNTNMNTNKIQIENLINVSIHPFWYPIASLILKYNRYLIRCVNNFRLEGISCVLS